MHVVRSWGALREGEFFAAEVPGCYAAAPLTSIRLALTAASPRAAGPEECLRPGGRRAGRGAPEDAPADGTDRQARIVHPAPGGRPGCAGNSVPGRCPCRLAWHP